MSWPGLALLTSEGCHPWWHKDRWQCLLAHRTCLNRAIMEPGIWPEALSVTPWIAAAADADHKWPQRVLFPSSHYCTKTPLPASSAHREWHQSLVLSSNRPWLSPLGFAVCPQLTHHRAAAWLPREETPARCFQQQEHPRADELLSSEAPCSVSVFPTHAIARTKAGSSCEQPESFQKESFIPAK